MKPPRVYSLPILVLLLLLLPNGAPAQPALDALAIEVRGVSREFAYTNKQAAFVYGETNADNKTSWQGFNVYGHEYLDDYALVVNGKPLRRTDAVKTEVYPDRLIRTYSGGITEQVTLLDSIDVLTVVLTAQRPFELGVTPWLTDGTNPGHYDVVLRKEVALIARQKHRTRTDQENFPVWLAVHGPGMLPQSAAIRDGMRFAPATLIGSRKKSQTIVFAVGDNQQETEELARRVPAQATRYFEARRARMEDLLHISRAQTGDPHFDKALAWAKLSLDALIMNQTKRGIFAGLPWFNNYWGRDTFISLPGATLVTGRYREAKEILRSFADYQQRDSTSSDYGRIPNIVTLTERAYNTADGTPRFTIMAKEYIEKSGDSRFMLEIYPVILRAIEGTLRYHCDSTGFLVHGDAETWMDAVGPDGPWSPRGNRANDVQALWSQQLQAGLWFASRLGDITSARRWNAVLVSLRSNFTREFVREGKIADHLNQDGSVDLKVRPNQIFTLPLLDKNAMAGVVADVTNHLTYQYGVASLSQDDENFHPYHQYPPYYPKDAAYHNGTVWTWLQGPLISALCQFGKQDFSWELTANAAHQILDRGAVGTQSELLDAVPRKGEYEPRLSGTFSQAWNLAEFVRTFYEDYLGYRSDLLNHEIVIAPHIPLHIREIKASVPFGDHFIELDLNTQHSPRTLSIRAGAVPVNFTVNLQIPARGGRTISTRFTMEAHKSAKVELGETGVTLSVTKSKPVQLQSNSLTLPSLAEPLALLHPRIREGLTAMRGPEYPLISHEEVKAINHNCKILVDVSDPPNDDRGVHRHAPEGGYTYPRNSAFVPGAFDITHFTVCFDSSNAYFTLRYRGLSNPGWHPEYGFQLTYTAIAIHRGGQQGPGGRIVPQNANFTLDQGHAFDRLVLVGGGIRVQDQKGEILAAYVPAEPDAADPLGDVSTSTIRFGLPISLLGIPDSSWTFTVLVGAQDDHGGAGLGEFRSVNKETSEWFGGGRMNPEDPNIYDMLVAPAR